MTVVPPWFYLFWLFNSIDNMCRIIAKYLFYHMLFQVSPTNRHTDGHCFSCVTVIVYIAVTVIVSN